jgi:hypothetical protein
MRIAAFVCALAVCTASAGCLVGSVDDTDVDELSLDTVDRYQTLTRLNAQPYTSDLGSFAINCYVAGDLTAYRKIHPDRAGANVTLTPGTVIVREVLDAGGQVSKLTVMAKGPPGYDPRLGDWWFAVTDPRGVPLTENGVVQLGRLTQCHNCHIDRGRDDFLFGVPSGT